MKANRWTFTKIEHRRSFIKRSLLALAASQFAINNPLNKILAIPNSAQRKPASSTQEYEFIVVGSGAGGGPLAANLARAGFEVLLLEAGPNTESELTRTPGLHARASEQKDIAWSFYVEHYENKARAMRDTKYQAGKGILYPRGCTLGGSTQMNAMITMYPDNEDWSFIQNSTGDNSWHPKLMRKYFQKLEKNRYDRWPHKAGAHYGYKGWLSTEQASPTLALKDPNIKSLLLGALREEGFGDELFEVFLRGGNLDLDPNDWRYVVNKTNAVVNVPKATFKGVRSGSRGYILDTARTHPNLKIKTNVHVTKVVFDPNDSSQVIGVEYQEGKHLYEASAFYKTWRSVKGEKGFVRASKEVILSGGAYNSPQLLMLSGVGDKNHLESEKIGIKTIHHLPGVGRNLQDRYEVGVVSEFKKDFKLLRGCGPGDNNDACLRHYRVDPQNSVYSANGAVVSLIKKSTPWKTSPDLFLFAVPGDFRGYYPGYSNHVLQRRNRFTWVILKAHTANTAGWVKLKSNNPFEQAEVNFKYFKEGNDINDSDLQAVVEGVKLARKMNSKFPIKGRLSKEIWPSSKFQSDQSIQEFVMNESWGHHASCTNKMGPANDDMSVVDSRFVVHGTQNLRVVDASVFPKIPGMFIVAPTYMISEKASEEIINKWR